MDKIKTCDPYEKTPPSFAPQDVIESLRAKIEEVDPEDSSEYYRLIREFIQSLLEQKQRFKYVFRTEKGSLYFVFHSGECLRFKKRDEEEENYDSQPVMSYIFFIRDSNSVQKIERDKHGNTFSIAFSPVEYQQGVVPIEIGLLYEADSCPLKVRKEGEQIIITSLPFKEIRNIIKYHIGHLISEVIK